MCTSAFAADDPSPEALARAKQLYENGEQLYAEGKYELAILAFDEAYDISHAPLLLYNKANACERLGKIDCAIESLERYRVYAPREEQDELRSRTDELRERLRTPEEEEEVHPLKPTRHPVAPWVLTVSGAALGVAGGTVAAITYDQSRDIIDDPDAWERLRPLNNGATVTGVAGGVAAIVGVTWLVTWK